MIMQPYSIKEEKLYNVMLMLLKGIELKEIYVAVDLIFISKITELKLKGIKATCMVKRKLFSFLTITKRYSLLEKLKHCFYRRKKYQ